MYSMNDYRTALEERDSNDIGSTAWNLGQAKVTAIVAAMVADGNGQMIREVVDEVYSLNDCGMEFESENTQFCLWLLESNGYKKEAQDLRELEWR